MSIWQEKVLTSSDLFWYIFSPDGELVNVDSITFEIGLKSDPETLIEGPTDATSFGTGKYYAAWVVPADQELTDYTITWRWKLTEDSVEQTGTRDFTVISPTVSGLALAPDIQPYITIQEFKDNSLIPTKDMPTDSELESKRNFVQGYIEKLTKQFFNARDLVLSQDGNGLFLIRADYPIIEITKIELKDSTGVYTEQALSGFEVYSKFLPDDRPYPKIVSKNAIFPKGFRNIRLTGKFGYVESDLTTPELIKKVTMLLMLAWLSDIATSKGNLRQAKTFWDKTNGRETHIAEAISYGTLTGDPEIDNILCLYTKAPSVSTIGTG